MRSASSRASSAFAQFFSPANFSALANASSNRALRSSSGFFVVVSGVRGSSTFRGVSDFVSGRFGFSETSGRSTGRRSATGGGGGSRQPDVATRTIAVPATAMPAPIAQPIHEGADEVLRRSRGRRGTAAEARDPPAWISRIFAATAAGVAGRRSRSFSIIQRTS